MKKRYQLTLTVENVEKLQDVCKEFGYGKDSLSSIVDKFITGIVTVGECPENEVNRSILLKLASI